MQLCRDVFRCYYSPFQEHTLLANCLRLELDETDDTNTTYIGAILKLGVPLIFWATFFLNPSLKFQFKLPVCFWFNITFKGTDCINGTLFERSLMPRKVNYTRILQIFSSKEGYENRYVIITYIQVIITTHNSKKKMFWRTSCIFVGLTRDQFLVPGREKFHSMLTSQFIKKQGFWWTTRVAPTLFQRNARISTGILEE